MLLLLPINIAQRKIEATSTTRRAAIKRSALVITVIPAPPELGNSEGADDRRELELGCGDVYRVRCKRCA